MRVETLNRLERGKHSPNVATVDKLVCAWIVRKKSGIAPNRSAASEQPQLAVLMGRSWPTTQDLARIAGSVRGLAGTDEDIQSAAAHGIQAVHGSRRAATGSART